LNFSAGTHFLWPISQVLKNASGVNPFFDNYILNSLSAKSSGEEVSFFILIL